MDHCASVLLAFPPEGPSLDDQKYDTAIRRHRQNAHKVVQENEQLILEDGLQLLNCLDPADHTISYFYVLSTLLSPTLKREGALPPDELLERVLVFLMKFDSIQIRYIGGLFADLLQHIGNIFPPAIAVDLLTNAILKIDPTSSMLTHAHTLLVSLAYKSDCIEQTYSVIEKPIVYYPGMSSTPDSDFPCNKHLPPPSYITRASSLSKLLTTNEVLEYDLVVGMMYCARKKWAQAAAAFERVLSFPTRDGGCSKIMVDAHNKWVLVSLLLSGRTPTVPAYTSISASKSFQVVGKPYISVATYFDSLDAAALLAEVQALAEVWQGDGNTYLMAEVLAAHQKWQIANLRRIYAKISLSEIRTLTRSAETGDELATDADVETIVQGMLESGMIKGRIEMSPPAGSPPYLEFGSTWEELTEAQFAAEIQASAERLTHLGSIFRTTGERLGTSRDYARYLVKEQKREKENGRAAVNSGGTGASMDSDGLGAFDLSVEEEDLMTGIVASH